LGSRRVGKGCSTASMGRRQAAIVGSSASAEIRRHLKAGEHKQGMGKLARVSVGAMGGRWWLSTVASTSPEGRSGRRRRSGLGVHTARGKEVEMDQV
jgi:hypothetical protein